MVDFDLTENLDIYFNENGDYATSDKLDTPIMCSLFQDKRDFGSKGHFLFNEDGSRLWQTKQSKVTPLLISNIELFTLEALKPLEDEGAISKVSAKARFINNTPNVEVNATDKYDNKYNKIYKI